MLLLATVEDVLFHNKTKSNKSSVDFQNILAVHLRLDKGRSDFGATAMNYSKDTTTKVSSTCLNPLQACAKMDDFSISRLQHQLDSVQQGNLVVINSCGGYHWRNPKEIDILEETDLTENEAKQFIWGKYEEKEDTTIDSKDGELYFTITKSGKVYYDTELKNHDALCDKFELDCDKVYKLMYYTSSNRNSRWAEALGIKGLRESVVYEHLDFEPFKITSLHLDKIEEFIKKVKQ